MKVLNLYACLGGNRLLWDNCEVTAVELDPELAKLYQERFPNDKVIIGDAHQYLLDHYKEFDFIWASPPCPTHSRIQLSQYTTRKMKYPDMKLYQEIIFLKAFYKGKFVIENVIPYYEPLIPATKIHRHLYWSNFMIPQPKKIRKNPDMSRTKDLITAMSKFHDYDFRKYKGSQPMNKVARNLVDYEVGKHIFDIARGIVGSNNTTQTNIFDLGA